MKKSVGFIDSDIDLINKFVETYNNDLLNTKAEDIDFLSESAFADACRPGNPRDTSVEEIAELYKALI